MRITDKTEIAALLADLTGSKSGVYRHYASEQLGGGKRPKAELNTALDDACARVLERNWGFPTSRTEVEAALAYELGQKSAPVYLVTMEEVNNEVKRYFNKLLLADQEEGVTALKNPTSEGSREMAAAGAAWEKVRGTLITLEEQFNRAQRNSAPGLSKWYVFFRCSEATRRSKNANWKEEDRVIGFAPCGRCTGTGRSKDDCPDCRPGSQLGCDSCNSSGKMKCEPCNGKGTVPARWVSGNGVGDNDDDKAPGFLDNLPGADDTATTATNAIEGREQIKGMRPVYANAYNAFDEMRQNNPNRQDIQMKVEVLIAVLAREADGMFDREDNAAGDNARGAGGLSEELTAIVYDEIAIQFPDFDPASQAGRRQATNYCKTYAEHTGRANAQGTTPENPEPEEAGVTNDV